MLLGLYVLERINDLVRASLQSCEDILEHLVAHGSIGVHLNKQGLSKLRSKICRGFKIFHGLLGILLQLVQQS